MMEGIFSSPCIECNEVKQPRKQMMGEISCVSGCGNSHMWCKECYIAVGNLSVCPKERRYCARRFYGKTNNKK